MFELNNNMPGTRAEIAATNIHMTWPDKVFNLPWKEVVRQFNLEMNPDKRVKMIDWMVQRPEGRHLRPDPNPDPAPPIGADGRPVELPPLPESYISSFDRLAQLVQEN